MLVSQSARCQSALSMTAIVQAHILIGLAFHVAYVASSYLPHIIPLRHCNTAHTIFLAPSIPLDHGYSQYFQYSLLADQDKSTFKYITSLFHKLSLLHQPS